MASLPIRPPQQPALNVAPLNSMPYIDPIRADDNDNSSEPQGDMVPVRPAHPALVYLPSQPTEEDMSQLLSVTRNGVVLTGSAAIGTIGPVVGKRDVFESKETYLFRVSLPGVQKEDFTCDVSPEGRILIKGVTTTGEKFVYKNSMRFEMQTQNLCPPGHFSIAFQLPGPVQSQELTGHFGIDGIFEGVVKKKFPSDPSASGASASGTSASGASAPQAFAPRAFAPGGSVPSA